MGPRPNGAGLVQPELLQLCFHFAPGRGGPPGQPPSPSPHLLAPRSSAAEPAARAEASGVGPGNQPVDLAGGAPRGPALRGHRLASGPGPAKAAVQAPSAPKLGLGPPRPRRLGSRAQVAGQLKALRPRIKKDPAEAGSCRRQKPSPCMARTTKSAKPMAPGRTQAWALALMRRLSLRLKPKAMPAPSNGRGPGTLWV